MITSLIARTAQHGQRDVDRFGAWVEAIAQLRMDWSAGRRHSPEELRAYLRFVPDEQQSDAMQDLIAEHLFLSWRERRALPLESYFTPMASEFPEWTSPSCIPAELVEDEFLARHQQPYGDTPELIEYERRFPSRPDIAERLRSRCLENGRFVRLRRVGQGAIGEVWQAFDHQTRQLVAIKHPRPDNAAHETVIQHFAAEARVMAGVVHPRIIAMRECFTSPDGTTFGIMPWVAGPSLSDRIVEYHQCAAVGTKVQRRDGLIDLLRVFAEVCDTIARAHEHSIVHRDLKPGNIALNESGQAVILDWGMAQKCVAKTTTPGSPSEQSARDHAPTIRDVPPTIIAGTPAYMAPEQVDGIADERSDIFGLGAVLYEILTGRPPHDWPHGQPPADWCARVRAADFLMPCQVRSLVPKQLDAICRRALSRVPESRYPSADAIHREMRSYIATATSPSGSWWSSLLFLLRGGSTPNRDRRRDSQAQQR